jgi:hypothetical protein
MKAEPPKTRARKIAAAAGALLGAAAAVAVAAFSLQRYGWPPAAILLSFILLAVQDARTGKINILALAFPVVLVALFHLDVFLSLFIRPFIVLAALWAVVYFLMRRSGKKLDFGFGDVAAVPLALALAAILAQLPGVLAFGVVTPIFMLAAILRRKTIRLVPWLLPGVLAAFALGFFL